MLLRTAVRTDRLATLSSRILGNWEPGIPRICGFQSSFRPRMGFRTAPGRTFRNHGRPVSSQLRLLVYQGLATER